MPVVFFFFFFFSGLCDGCLYQYIVAFPPRDLQVHRHFDHQLCLGRCLLISDELQCGAAWRRPSRALESSHLLSNTGHGG